MKDIIEINGVKYERIAGPAPDEIICLIDSSGSMWNQRMDMIGGFNAFLKDQKSLDKPANITIDFFDQMRFPKVRKVPIKDVEEFDEKTYNPNGPSTALLDALGGIIKRTEARVSDTNAKVIIAVLTDGKENSSRVYTKSQIKDLIDAKTADGWEFIFLAADRDSFAEALSIGFQGKDTHIYNKEDMRGATLSYSAAIMNKRMSQAV